MQKKLLTNGNAFKRTDDRRGGIIWYLDELRTKAEHTMPSITTYVNQNKETCVLPNMGGTGGGHNERRI